MHLKLRIRGREQQRNQAKDVERSRTAAENSAAAAKTLAEASLKGLTITELSVRAAELRADRTRRLYDLNFTPSAEVTYDMEKGPRSVIKPLR